MKNVQGENRLSTEIVRDELRHRVQREVEM